MIDKSAFDIIGPYYQKAPPGRHHAPGRLCDATVYYLPSGGLDALKFDIEAASRGEAVRFTIGAVEKDTFSHKPILLPRRLEHDEAFVVAVAKRRPVVVVSSTITAPAVPGLPRQDFPDVFLVCPLYSFRDNHPPEFRLRVEAWEYNMLFHLPGSDDFELHEGFLRFDRCLVVPKGQLRLRNVALSDAALLALQNCISWFLTGELDKFFAEYRKKLLELLDRALEIPPKTL